MLISIVRPTVQYIQRTTISRTIDHRSVNNSPSVEYSPVCINLFRVFAKMAQSNANKTEMKQHLDKTDEKLRHKYLEVVKSLELEELKHFNKMRYREMAITDLK